jgi:hypothetical protein
MYNMYFWYVFSERIIQPTLYIASRCVHDGDVGDILGIHAGTSEVRQDYAEVVGEKHVMKEWRRPTHLKESDSLCDVYYLLQTGARRDGELVSILHRNKDERAYSEGGTISSGCANTPRDDCLQ